MKASFATCVALAWPALAAAQATFTAQEREVGTASQSDLFLWLSGPGGSVLSDNVFSCDCEHELDYQGVLAPGSYTLTVHASVHGDPFCDLVQCITYETTPPST